MEDSTLDQNSLIGVKIHGGEVYQAIQEVIDDPISQGDPDSVYE
jgi:hypothetical protein